jgi:hypothetical protein
MSAADKPLDLGTGVVCASFGDSGSWLSVGTVHPIHGFVELNGLPPFDERGRGDPAATRRHRGAMTEERFAFLSVEPRAAVGRVSDERDWAAPSAVVWHGPGVLADAMASGGRTIVQRWRLTADGARVRFSGTLDRPALAEITELDPPSPTGARTRLVADGARLLVLAESLPAAAVVEASTGSWQFGSAGVAELVAPGSVLELRVALAPLARPPDPDVAPARRIDAAPAAPPGSASVTERLIARAIAYVRECTALQAGESERVILTDHRLLPLSWTRDAYYQALLLLATGDSADQQRVAEHLRWLWLRCERPDGRWVRSHHADGRRKDLAFQADQQLYPLIELTDYWRAAGKLPARAAWDELVADSWRAALDAVDPPFWLMSSTENAADDPAAAPYIGASQIVLWYAARRLAELADGGALTLDAGELRDVAVRVRDSFARRLVADGRWAYATDGRGGTVAYHDANDLPVALAPLWGFCSADDPAWLATMAFAFSPLNPAWAAGELAGLGSAHTPGAWTLGDVQGWIAARARGDGAAAARALERLDAVAFSDGMLPEAYSTDGRRIRRVRHWFAWPGAALAALMVLDQAGQLESRLAAS